MTHGREQIEESLFRALLNMNHVKCATREQLMAGYAARAPQLFVRYDGWPDMPPDDDMPPDEDGDALCSGHTVELMNGAGVRVLIDPATDPKDAARILRKIADSVERYPSDGWMGARQRAARNAGRIAREMPPELVQLLTAPGSEAALRALACSYDRRYTEKAPLGLDDPSYNPDPCPMEDE
jgi:hypothetical protein